MLQKTKFPIRNYLVLTTLFLGAAYIGCGGTGNSNDAGLGVHPISDGGFGASLTIELTGGGNEIPTAGKKDFIVTALDPKGLPLARRRVFCETEKGLALVEPTTGFEHTNLDGKMSGVLGGVTPGSFLLECRLEEGFNLFARKSFLVSGDVPPGFAGFPGAGGGNLGGGVLVPNPDAQIGDVAITAVGFSVVGAASEINPGLIDLSGDICSAGPPIEYEPYGFDSAIIHIKNPLLEAVTIDSATISIDNNSDPETVLGVNATIAAQATDQTIAVEFSDFPNADNVKYLAGLPGFAANIFALGTYNVTFKITGETASGESISSSVTTAVTFNYLSRCP